MLYEVITIQLAFVFDVQRRANRQDHLQGLHFGRFEIRRIEHGDDLRRYHDDVSHLFLGDWA